MKLDKEVYNMGIYFGRGNVIEVIDRTLPEICASHNKFSIGDIVQFCTLLRQIGVDLFEIDAESINQIKESIDNFPFVFRINQKSDVEFCINNNIDKCILDSSFLSDFSFIKKLYDLKIYSIVEFKIEKITGLFDLWNYRELDSMKFIKRIRISGMSHFTSLTWPKLLTSIGEELKVELDICPEDTLYNATAICVDGLSNGLNVYTTSFAGYSRTNGYAPLEEILAVIKFLNNSRTDIDLSILPQILELFNRISGKEISKTKAILGSDIFKYESGIHADGIGKKTITYEPFEPALIGLKRILTIGKHSGSKAIISKLNELGIDYSIKEISHILVKVRDKSIELKRNLFDEELIEICEVL